MAALSGKGGNEAPNCQGREMFPWQAWTTRFLKTTGRERLKLRTITILVTDSVTSKCVCVRVCTCVHGYGWCTHTLLASCFPICSVAHSLYHHPPHFTCVVFRCLKRHLQFSQGVLQDWAFISVLSLYLLQCPRWGHSVFQVFAII